MTSKCNCGSQKNYADCCERFLSGKEHPHTPEELMRSRYTAYTLGNIDYIMRTMKSPAADDFNAEETKEWSKQVKWLKLEVLNSSPFDTKGYVEFMAHFTYADKKQVIHERSEFILENGRWYYIDGLFE